MNAVRPIDYEETQKTTLPGRSALPDALAAMLDSLILPFVRGLQLEPKCSKDASGAASCTPAAPRSQRLRPSPLAER